MELPSNLRGALDELESWELRGKECGKQAQVTKYLRGAALTSSNRWLLGELRTVKIPHPHITTSLSGAEEDSGQNKVRTPPTQHYVSYMMIRETYIFCNYCLEDYCREYRHFSCWEIRSRAESDGWKYRNGKDICPKCIANNSLHLTPISPRPRQKPSGRK